MMIKIEIECETEIQSKTVQALAQSLEQGSVNIDKFLMWAMKTYEPGNSMFLTMLKSLGS